MFFPYTAEQAFQLGQFIAWALCEFGPLLMLPCGGVVPFVPPPLS
ncbi:MULTISPECIES: hypothetical protein [Hoyosella]|uniref:Uncharacterized protein n=2 Tax=Hoyosella TaxID=697025 RepID=F6EIF0_HOYSD|nr:MULTISPECIES: hypothetical protein [Hoyosella]AEF42442.1 hypothetical protein AS9A_4008 [Hoyosella subflava DQS3-9A1]MBB3039688.1 hypothetical protein [Hoyosella altamirensis]